MFPFNFEWVWDMAHVVFMGGLWYALIIIIAGVGYCIRQTSLDMENEEEGEHHH